MAKKSTSKTRSAPAVDRAAAGSPFDRYACAALTGLLANPAIMTAVGARSWINDTGAKLPQHIIHAAMGYAKLAVETRQQVMANVERIHGGLWEPKSEPASTPLDGASC